MRARKLSDDQVRDIVCARLTRGGAFMHKTLGDYDRHLNEVKVRLYSMTRAEIIAHWPHHCYDF